MKKLTLFVSILLMVKLSAQTVTWKVLKDDPYDIKNLSVSIDPLFLDLNGQNGYSFGWGLRAEYMMGKLFLFHFDSRFGFGTNGYRASDKNTKNYFYTEGGIGFIIKHSDYTRNVPIILSQSTSYYSGYYGTYQVTTTRYIRGGVSARHHGVIALRTGYFSYSNSLYYKNLSDSLLRFKGNGSDFTYKDSINNKNFSKAYGATTVLSLYGGIQFRTIRQLQLDVDGYGFRENSVYYDIFIDLLFAPVVSIKDFTSSGKTYNIDYSKKSHFGWRMGFAKRHPKDQGFNFKFEFGVRPGARNVDGKGIINLKNWYAMLTYALYFPLKVRPVYGEVVQERTKD
ncbi:MAG: hypothetical protein KatS3mg027_0841 [Bacteroidia bacterium]|nr:MAG: hypothetical protein KatS3mg027_0841 [Bacteroidia bacterium]